MKGQCTEITAAETSTVTGKTELDLLNRRDPAFFFIHRMIRPHKRQMIYIVHLLLAQRIRRRILYHIPLIAVIFYQNLCLIRVGVLMLDTEASCILLFLFFDFFKGWQIQRFRYMFHTLAAVHRSPDKCDIFHIQPGSQRIRDLNDRMFSHAVRDQIRPGIQQYASFHLIGPVIVMPQSPKARLNTAQDDRRLFIRSADQIAVDDHCPVRPVSHLSTRRIGVFLSVFFGYGIMIYHRIHISGRYEESKTRFAEHLNAFRIFPVRLGNHSHRVSPAF